MAHEAEPWIVTDERLPCLVISGRLTKPLSAGEISGLCGRGLKIVDNVYNCMAFEIRPGCPEVFCVRPNGRCAIVVLQLSVSLPGTEEFGAIQERVLEPVTRLNEILMTHFNSSVTLDRAHLEITGRTPN
jgi:hypothetical protein